MTLQHQIGGHASVTSDESGTLVIKPAAPREIAFYQLLHSLPAPLQKDLRIPAASNLATQQPTADDSIAGVSSNGETKGTNVSLVKREILLSHLQNFLPKFYGTLKVESAPPVAVAELVAVKQPSMQVDQDMHGAGTADGKSITAQRSAEFLIEASLPFPIYTTPFRKKTYPTCHPSPLHLSPGLRSA
ncbi:hypothetical protein QFC21_004096 [Naganishia friedmannii]|uniref:Uncharacterized protein n=1 Tax=Naganishia friedmannii TaxID=89922 RepID=A0ACC2VJC9_9TREE|nr:hypothetical protein QFC21_004096 [Naganishia friedmannii]